MPTPKTATCKQGHAWTPENTLIETNGRSCRICRNARKRERRRLRKYGPHAVIPHGQSVRSIAMKLAWITRRERFGPSGCSEKQRARHREIAQRTIMRFHRPQRRRAHCKAGHPMVPSNLMTARNGDRRCRACWRLRVYGRPEWITFGTARVNVTVHDKAASKRRAELRRALIRSHPDHGGSRGKLDEARKTLDRFLAEEQRWYASIGLQAPWESRRIERAAS